MPTGGPVPGPDQLTPATPWTPSGPDGEVPASRRAPDRLGERLRLWFEHAPDGKAVLTPDGVIVEANPALHRMLGHAPGGLVGLTLADITHPEDLDPCLGRLGELLAGRCETFHMEKRYLRSDGTHIWCLATASVIRDPDGRPVQVVGQVQDITARKSAERRLAESEARFRLVTETVPAGVFLLDADLGVVYHNRRYAELVAGDPDARITGRRWVDLLPAPVRQRALEACRRVLATGEAVSSVFRVGDRVLRIDRRPAPGPDGPTGVVGLVFDVTDTERAREDLAHRASHDPVTGLWNRARIIDHLADRLGDASGDRQLAVLLADLDGFKVINDSLGHQAGDELLAGIGRRLRTVVRSGEAVGRFGGDEFVIVAEGLGGPEGAAALAERVLAALGSPLPVADRQVVTSASIGIALAADPATDPADLIRDADTAMYRAKALGRSRYVVFDESLRRRAVERLLIEGDLRRAVADGALEVHYQPEVDLLTGRPVGVEALVRWPHPTRGLLGPAMFIDIAEETGLIVELGAHVLATAAATVGAWRRDHPELADLRLSVNLSPRQITHPALTEHVTSSLTRSGLPPHQLCLEITEGVLMEDPEVCLLILDALRAIGLSIALDDFGTGYSSLTYLKRLPVDTVKIDRSFVADIGGDDPLDGDSALVAAMVSIARTLGMRVVAEGVERPAQATELRGLGCATAQGFLWSPPLPADEALAWILERSRTLAGGST